MEEVVQEVLYFAVVLAKVIISCIIGSVKALLPNGVLPRKSVSGDVCLVTGAGSGIGRLMAIEFAKLGCTLVLWDINSKGNEETKAFLGKTGAKVYTYTVDLSKRDAINATAALVKKEVGAVDILVNNAGVVTGKKIFDCPDELMEKTVAVNTNALLFLAKQFLPGMIERNHGHVVTIASIAGKCGVAGLVDYCASKHGAVGFHESLTAELQHQKADGVKTTVVCPFYINTGMFHGVETKSPNLLPIMEPSYVVECIMEAVLTDREELQLPRFSYIINFVLSMVPSSVKHLLNDYYGANASMDSFVGRKHTAVA